MKYLSYLCFLLVSITTISAQTKYYTKTGTTEFKASVEAFEPVEATNKSTTAVLNTEDGKMAALLFVKAFHFEIALMEEHFNENYMDSDKYPKATFKGHIQNFKMKDVSESPKEYLIKGTLNVRGKDKDIEAPAMIHKMGNTLMVNAKFKVAPGDFGIDIPSIVRKKIAESIIIQLDYELVPKQ